jgi:Galactose oxidase, central domain
MRIAFLLVVLLFDLTASSQFIPAPRHLEKLVYDSYRKKMILFGGAELPAGGKWMEPNYIAEWDGTKWEKKETEGPCGRRGHGWVYHLKDRKTYLIGGVTQTAGGGDSTLFDVWTWDGNKWEKNNEGSPFKEMQAVYNSASGTIIVRGDVNEKTKPWTGGMPQVFELWEYKNNRWKKLDDDAPVKVGLSQMVYHEKRKSVWLPVWENGKVLIWEWRNRQWNQSVPVDSVLPGYRNRYALLYIKATNKVYLFGGRNSSGNFINDLWEWDGGRWKQITGPNTPSVRASHAAITLKNAMIIYGGTGEKGKLMNEIWKWEAGEWLKIY